MIREQLERIINGRATLLGVGPMSTNCINAAISIANERNVPIMLIASRRQIDAEEFGGGYVNNWSTREFADYVLNRDRKGKVILCRDHGGPWQNNLEKNQKLCLRRAMESAKLSYQRDIEAGFQILHIDPSVDIWDHPSMEEIVDRALELYEFCWEQACRMGKRVEFEIGTEEQSGSTSGKLDFAAMLERINRHCEKYKMPKPLFVVVQNGTKVLETQNVGSFDVPLRIADEISPEIQVPLMSQVCMQKGVLMKAHNADYLSDESLQWYPRLGIHAANVAPEFGVAETRALLNILNENCMTDIRERFVELAYTSHKWEKWMKDNSDASELEKAVIAGHYIFSTNDYIELYEDADRKLERKGVNLGSYLESEVRKSIMRYLKDFRMVK